MSSLPADVDTLILGCGYLGRRVASRWLVAGRRVAALTRRNAETLRELSIESILGDVLDPASLEQLPAVSTVLYAVGLDRSAKHSMREVYVTGLSHVLDTLPANQKFIYVSSTSVYAQTDGEWVDEHSPTEPTDEGGKIILEAELLLRAERPDAIILRLAGIYGPDRLLRKQALLNGEALVGDAEKWLNLVHVADAANAVLAAESRGTLGETYNITGGVPVTRREFYSLLAKLLGVPEAKFDHRPEPGTPHRRIDCTKARSALGWSPCFPDFREGLTSAIQESTM